VAVGKERAPRVLTSGQKQLDRRLRPADSLGRHGIGQVFSQERYMRILAGLVLVLARMAQAASDRVMLHVSGYSSTASGQYVQGTTEKWLHGLPSIVCWGDSLTSASYPRILAKLTGRPVTSRGVGGNTSAQIA